MVWAWMLWSAHALETRTELWSGHGCSGQRMLLEHGRNYGSGMDALVSACSWNTNGIMVRAWMVCSAYALGTRTELWFGHGCSAQRVLLEHERNYGSGMDGLLSACSWNTNGIMVWACMLCSAHALETRTELWFGPGCSAQGILLEHERNYGSGMDALLSVYSWNTNGIMVRAWMLCSAYALGKRTELWFGHGWNYGWGMDALVSGCSWNTNGASPGTWRTRSQIPSIPLNKPYSSPHIIPFITPFQYLRHCYPGPTASGHRICGMLFGLYRATGKNGNYYSIIGYVLGTSSP